MMQLEGSLSVMEACRATQVSRAVFYRHLQESEPRQAETELRHRIQQIALENRFYGYRRVAAELRARGDAVNHKTVLRIMREDNLLCLRRRRYVLTTNSRHGFVKYPNLLPQLTPTAVNQIWVSDLTYIRVREQFLYLAIVLDAFSRRVVGWELGESLQAGLAVEALRKALSKRLTEPGIVHHSDQGIQYCCSDYVDLLLQNGFAISMSRKGNPYDNATAESFMKTLKVEEVYLRQYRDHDDARASIEIFIEDVYNLKRLHSSLGYQSPAAYERGVRGNEAVAQGTGQ
jgi:putative transposase